MTKDTKKMTRNELTAEIDRHHEAAHRATVAGDRHASNHHRRQRNRLESLRNQMDQRNRDMEEFVDGFYR